MNEVIPLRATAITASPVCTHWTMGLLKSAIIVGIAGWLVREWYLRAIYIMQWCYQIIVFYMMKSDGWLLKYCDLFLNERVHLSIRSQFQILIEWRWAWAKAKKVHLKINIILSRNFNELFWHLSRRRSSFWGKKKINVQVIVVLVFRMYLLHV